MRGRISGKTARFLKFDRPDRCELRTNETALKAHAVKAPVNRQAITVPDEVVQKWQGIVNIMADIGQVPAALIMKIDPPHIKVFRASESANNPYHAGDREYLAGLYCEQVIKTKDKLLVANALMDSLWDKNRDIELGMISYLGFPLLWPDGEVFGTICVLDVKENHYGKAYEKLMLQFRDIVETHLGLLWDKRELDKTASSCRRTVEELSSRGQHLETMVRQRTARLTKTNEQLRREITKREWTEGEAGRLTTVLFAIRDIMQFITRENDRHKLIQGVCDKLVETRSYHGAWIALFGESDPPVTFAQAGLGREFSRMAEQLKHAELPFCCRRAVDCSTALAIEDVHVTCGDCPLAGTYCGRAAMTAPLEHAGTVYGVLTVSLTPKTLAHTEEQCLFQAAVEDLGFALHDIELTEQHQRAEEEARRHHDELARVSRLSTMGEMATGVAHELNQPLTAIVLTADGCRRLIQAGVQNTDEVFDALTDVAAQAERAGKIIRSLRNFVRKREPRRTTTYVNDIVQEVVGLVEAEAKWSEVTLQLELTDGLPPVLADVIQIEQVILNLARNGIEAMSHVEPDQRRLTIRTSVSGSGDLEIAVQDRGCGLAGKDVDRVFDPFVTDKREGMGIGLSISRSIVEAHGGRIAAASNPDGGATFRVILPAASGGDSNGK